MTSTNDTAGRLIFNQAVNDVLQLLIDLSSANGRTAIRTARSLIEHAVNLRTVIGDLTEAQRYVDHLDQGPALLLDLKVGLSLLKGNDRKAYEHRLNTFGKPAKRRLKHAVEQWGQNFKRDWATTNLRLRSENAGLDDLYQLYRLASLVTHGSAGGSIGTVRDSSALKGLTYRLGNALELAPIAMFAGLKAYLSVLQSVQSFRQDLLVSVYEGPVHALLGTWPNYFVELRRLDLSLWPEGDLPRSTAVLAINRSGARKYFLHSPQFGVLFPAIIPDLSADLGALHREVGN